MALPIPFFAPVDLVGFNLARIERMGQWDPDFLEASLWFMRSVDDAALVIPAGEPLYILWRNGLILGGTYAVHPRLRRMLLSIP